MSASDAAGGSQPPAHCRPQSVAVTLSAFGGKAEVIVEAENVADRPISVMVSRNEGIAAPSLSRHEHSAISRGFI